METNVRALEMMHTALERISRYAVWLGGAAMLMCAIMVTVDVLCRKFFGITMSGSDEISGYVFAGGPTWAYSYCAIHRSNIRIDALYNILPPAVRAVLDIVGLVALLFYVQLLTRTGLNVFLSSWESNSLAISAMATPLWIPQMFWISGLLFFMFTLSFLIIYATTALATGNIARVREIAGTTSVEEEVEGELSTIDELKHKANEGGA